jgi:ABC-type antimicrobial peptide transport system permease subunit
MRRGSEAVIEPSSDYFKGYEIKNSLKQMFDQNYIEYFSLKSPISANLCFRSETSIENYGRTYDFTIYTKSISPLYFYANEKSDLKIAEQNENYKNYIPSEQLYFKEFIDKIGLSAIFTWEFNANLTTQFFLKISNQKGNMRFLLKPAFLLNSAPGLQMNAVPSNMIQRTSITSFPIFLDIINKCNKYYPNKLEDSVSYSYLDFPIEQINLKLNSSMNIKSIIDGINDILYENDLTVFIWFFHQMKEDIDRIKNLVHTVFYVVCTIVLFFCFFNLTASMTINIFEQKKEIAIMRALGMKKSHVIFIYICEAIVLILSSSIIGTIIGSLISYTMSLQWQMFTNVNVSFYINKSNLIYIIFFSIIGGIFSTIIPAYRMLSSSIASLIKEI